ncbi:hypothetical protein COOONC_21336 [Cooperia oncophora]
MYVGVFGYPLVIIVVLTVLYIRAFNSEEEKADLEQPYHPAVISHDYCFLHRLRRVIIILIRKTLSKNAEHMSERTVQLHRTLLKSLIFQTQRKDNKVS